MGVVAGEITPLPAPAQPLVALDSDGCVCDSMNRKHREAFLPALIDVFELEARAGEAAVETIAGQEYGNKTEQLRTLLGKAHATGREGTLLVGDAPGDMQAARDAGVGFFPILPGDEAASWKRLREEGLPRLFEERFDADYQSGLDVAFDSALQLTKKCESIFP